MKVSKEQYGILADGQAVTRFTLENSSGLSISTMDYGANLLSVRQPDRNGEHGEITLGFDTLDRYEGKHPYFGASIGRYANRISGSAFTIKGKTYKLFANDSGAHLHGGKEGFNRKMWNADIEADGAEGRIIFHRISPDGEENYPGNLDVRISFVLTESGEFLFEYNAKCDAATPINLTNHTYWNLDGPGNSIYEHLLTIYADKLLEVDENLIPTGNAPQVDGTPFNFQSEKTMGRDLDAAERYDHCYILSDSSNLLKKAALVKSPRTGRCMSVETTLPAIQFYTANMLEDTIGRQGILYSRHGAFCLETGAYNNAVNIPKFPNSILLPRETYRHTTRHRFWAE
ncbi:MAG: galactose mutarotase [Spirochaetales bacterium]|jgi:aldose 1-epimerase|nr:galactose mutarotase [Spirochaetales bacterium]